jgi:N-acetylneuraminate lyase
LSKVDGIIGLKFTSKDTFEMQQLIEACGKDFLIFNDPDESCLAGLAVGACGAIGSTYNIMPEKFVSLYNHFQQGNLREARVIQYELNGLIRELLKYDFIAFEREILRLQGFEVGNARKPIQQLTDVQRLEIRKVAEQFSFLGI